MTEGLLLASLVDGVIGVTLLEGAALLLVRRATGRGPAPRDYLLNMAAGLSLMLALRAGVRDAGIAWVAACLLVAGLAHAIDIARRWRRSPRPAAPAAAPPFHPAAPAGLRSHEVTP